MLKNNSRPNRCRRARPSTSILWPLLIFASACGQPEAADSGFDFTGLEPFWHLADIISSGQTPSDGEWQALMTHPGYDQIERSGRRASIVRDVMPFVFDPSMETGLDSVLADTATNLTSVLHRRAASHLLRVREMRSEVDAFQTQLQNSTLISGAYEHALAYLPREKLANVPRPAVYVLLFENNGFGGSAVAVDLLSMMERGTERTTLYLGHELHHAYMRHVDSSRSPRSGEPTAFIYYALSALHWEGVASLIDKQQFIDQPPNASWPTSLVEQATSFADAFQSSPAVLQHLDSVLSGIATDGLDPDVAGRELRSYLPSGGHPTGMFMARHIQEAFGTDRLLTITDPFTFLLTYNESGNAPQRLSPTTVEYVRLLRESYRAP